jgi:hypothetical protein
MNRILKKRNLHSNYFDLKYFFVVQLLNVVVQSLQKLMFENYLNLVRIVIEYLVQNLIDFENYLMLITK